MKVLVACEESQTVCKAGVSRKGGASKARSKFSPGIAAAMAEQWGCLP